MKAKAVVRDVGRVMDMPLRRRRQGGQADPRRARHDARQGARGEPGAQGHGAERRARRANCSASRSASRAWPGTPRCTPPASSSRRRPVTEFAPLYKGSRDEITTQWGMKEIERIGLLKMDFLGLSTLTLDPRRARADRRDDRACGSSMEDLPLDRREDLRPVLRGPDPRHLPVRELGHAATSCARPSRGSSKTSSR